MFYPTMIQSLTCCYSFLWIYFQQPCDQVTALSTEIVRKRKRTEIIFLLILRKRGLHCQHLIHKHANAPTVDFIIIKISFCYLWRDVIKSSTKSFPLNVSFDRPTKISNFKLFSKANNIFRFQISMNNTISMQVLNP